MTHTIPLGQEKNAGIPAACILNPSVGAVDSDSEAEDYVQIDPENACSTHQVNITSTALVDGVTLRFLESWKNETIFAHLDTPYNGPLHPQTRRIRVGNEAFTIVSESKYALICCDGVVALVIRDQAIEEVIFTRARAWQLPLGEDAVPLSTAFSIYGGRKGGDLPILNMDYHFVWAILLRSLAKLERHSSLLDMEVCPKIPSAHMQEVTAMKLQRRIFQQIHYLTKVSLVDGSVMTGRLLEVRRRPATNLIPSHVEIVVFIEFGKRRWTEKWSLKNDIDEIRAPSYGWFFVSDGDGLAGTFHGQGIKPPSEWTIGAVVAICSTKRGRVRAIIDSSYVLNFQIDDDSLYDLVWQRTCKERMVRGLRFPLTSLLTAATYQDVKSILNLAWLEKLFAVEVRRLSNIRKTGNLPGEEFMFSFSCYEFSVTMWHKMAAKDERVIRVRNVREGNGARLWPGILSKVEVCLGSAGISTCCYFMYRCNGRTRGLCKMGNSLHFLNQWISFDTSQQASDMLLGDSNDQLCWDEKWEAEFDGIYQSYNEDYRKEDQMIGNDKSR